MNSICIFGVFVADLCFFGNKIPVKGETVLGNNHIVGPGGKGSNQAIAAARLNGNVHFITKVGNDNHADMAFSLYKEAGNNLNNFHYGCFFSDLTGFMKHPPDANLNMSISRSI